MSNKLSEEELIKTIRLLGSGLTRRQIARELFISEAGLQSRLKIIYRELGVDNRKAAFARATKLGWLDR